MKYVKSNFNQDWYQLWQNGFHLPTPKNPAVFFVSYQIGNKYQGLSKIRMEADSAENALERTCFHVTMGTDFKPEEVALKSVHDEQENLLWVNEYFYNLIQKKNQFRGLERREFIKRFGTTAAAILYGFRLEQAFGLIPFGFIRKSPALEITINGGTNLNITATWLNQSYGWNTSSGPSIRITNTGNIISSSTTAALIFNVSMPAGKSLTFINSTGSYIVGRGGNGGTGGNSSYPGTAGTAGTLAIQALSAVTFINNGIIGGGGGGGGGGAGSNGASGGGGGGGGAGYSTTGYSTAGTGGNKYYSANAGNGSAGSTGTMTSGGNGGVGGYNSPIFTNTPAGTGGSPSVAGGAGTTKLHEYCGGGGGGGGGLGAAGGYGGAGWGSGAGGGGAAGSALSGKWNVNAGAGISGSIYGSQN